MFDDLTDQLGKSSDLFPYPEPPDELRAERVGVEPTVPLRVHKISNLAPSATRTPLLERPWGLLKSGERRIRTYGTVAGTLDFESSALDQLGQLSIIMGVKLRRS
jgi:hypothetical protein